MRLRGGLWGTVPKRPVSFRPLHIPLGKTWAGDQLSGLIEGGDPLVEIDGEYAVADAFQDGAAGGFEGGGNIAKYGRLFHSDLFEVHGILRL